jgi:CRISPR-associated protein Cas7/Cst2/DevR subtype I-B
MTYLAGKIALDVTAGAPNNGRGENNVGEVKQLRIGRDTHPYVSAQAFRRWVRDSLPAAEPRSPVTKVGAGQRQQAYTGGRPDKYLDDDLFGYMVAVKGESYQRDTVLATGTLVSVAPRLPARDFGTMSRGFGAGDNPVIHEHQLYTAELAGDVLLDLPRIGTFELDAGGLRRNLTPSAVQEAVAAGAEEMEFRGVRSIRLPLPERRRRAALLLRALAEVRGGAKKALHYGERAPALVLLAPVKGGNNPFTRILAAPSGRVMFDADVLREEIAAWGDELDGPVRLGWAPGFLGDQRDLARKELADLISAGTITIGHPRVLLQALASQIEAGDSDNWFADDSLQISPTGS